MIMFLGLKRFDCSFLPSVNVSLPPLAEWRTNVLTNKHSFFPLPYITGPKTNFPGNRYNIVSLPS